MKKAILVIILLCLVCANDIPVHATQIVAPEVPDGAESLMPAEQNSFTEDLLYVLSQAMKEVYPEITGCLQTCLLLTVTAVAASLIGSFQGIGARSVQLGSVLIAAFLLFPSAGSMIESSADTVNEISQYGRLLLPVMTAALAAQGGSTSSAALYAGTAFFDSILCNVLSKLLLPLVTVFLVLAILSAVSDMESLKRGKEILTGWIHWSMKTLLYIFTGYLTVTGVVGGVTDQVALKATKLTLSSAVPVIGGVLSDASEAILVSAGVVKNAVGVWGLISVIAIVITPFLKVAIQYLLLKLSAVVCSMFADKSYTSLIGDVAAAMGMLLAMTGAVCLLFLISTVCFMKGME